MGRGKGEGEMGKKKSFLAVIDVNSLYLLPESNSWLCNKSQSGFLGWPTTHEGSKGLWDTTVATVSRKWLLQI